MKSGLVAIILVLGVGAYLVFGPLSGRDTPTWPDSRFGDVLIAGKRGNLETHYNADKKEWEFRVHLRGNLPSDVLTQEEVTRFIGPDGVRQATVAPRNAILRFFNITSWTNLIWISVGLFGQLTFSGRIIIQWLVSEKRGVSTVPVIFWWLSLFGGMSLFSYFVWRQDFVGILGQAPGVVIYARNLHMIYRPRIAKPSDGSPPAPAR